MRIGDLVVNPDQPYSVTLKAQPLTLSGANHGWDATRFKEMHGVFMATGPAFRENAKLPTVDMVHIYPLILEVLGLRLLTSVDGKLSAMKSALKQAK